MSIVQKIKDKVEETGLRNYAAVEYANEKGKVMADSFLDKYWPLYRTIVGLAFIFGTFIFLFLHMWTFAFICFGFAHLHVTMKQLSLEVRNAG